MRLLPLLLSAALLTTGCSGGAKSPSGPGGPGPGSPVGDFGLQVLPGSLTLLPGETGFLVVNLAASGGFDGAVTLSASGLPAGVSAAPSSMAAGDVTGTLELTANAAAAAGPVTVTVTGSSGGRSRSATFALSVAASLPAGGASPVFQHVVYLDLLGFSNPNGVAVDPTDGLVYVVSDQGGGLAIYDPAANVMDVVAIPSSERVAVNPGTGVVYAAGSTGNLVIVSGASVTQKAVGGALADVAVDVETNQVFVGDRWDQTLHQLDPASGHAVVDSWRFSDLVNGPVRGPLTVDSRRHLVYAALHGGVGIVNATNGDWQVVDLSRVNSTLTQSPAAVVVDDRSGAQYVLGRDGFNGTDGWIHFLDDTTMPDSTTLAATNAAVSLALDPGTNKLYVADPANRAVHSFDMNTRTFVKTVTIPASSGIDEGPLALAVDPETHAVYATMRHWNGRPALAVIDGR